jgi:ubiquinone/menaquinone biosynthesis C-methylase UbiE
MTKDTNKHTHTYTHTARNEPTLNYFDIKEARVAYQAGKNVTELLRKQKGLTYNTPEIIEAAYDLQAGTYIASTKNNIHAATAYAAELASLLNQHIEDTTTLLDIGTGELTTISHTLQQLRVKPKTLLAFDISWSRIYLGCSYADEILSKTDRQRLLPFVADINEIPLCDKSVDVVTSSHALEPNGSCLPSLLAELFRITRKKLVLFEPCYEINTEEGKARMDRLGYIKNMDGVITQLGGTLLDKTKIENVSNPLNPTVCFVIEPPKSSNLALSLSESQKHIFSIPGTNISMVEAEGFYVSKDTGLCFPILKNIPILKSNSAILASAFDS